MSEYITTMVNVGLLLLAAGPYLMKSYRRVIKQERLQSHFNDKHSRDRKTDCWWAPKHADDRKYPFEQLDVCDFKAADGEPVGGKKSITLYSYKRVLYTSQSIQLNGVMIPSGNLLFEVISEYQIRVWWEDQARNKCETFIDRENNLVGETAQKRFDTIVKFLIGRSALEGV